MKEITLKTKQFSITAKMLSSQELDPKIHPAFVRTLSNFVKKFENMCKTRGIRGTLAYFKEVRLCYTRWLSGSPLQPKDLVYTVGMTNEGLPKLLGDLLPFVRDGDKPDLTRCIMTLLSIGRTIELKAEPTSLSSITDPGPSRALSPDILADFRKFVERRLKKTGALNPVRSFTKYPVMLGYGPHGPALRYSIWESTMLSQEQRDNLEVLCPGLNRRIDTLLKFKPLYYEKF